MADTGLSNPPPPRPNGGPFGEVEVDVQRIDAGNGSILMGSRAYLIPQNDGSLKLIGLTDFSSS